MNWNDTAKRILKSELVKRGISHSELATLLQESKGSIDSKISRGSFSASFFLHCLSIIGCTKIEIEHIENNLSIAAEPNTKYEKLSNEK